MMQTITEKEKIIEEKVSNLKSNDLTKLCFYVTGNGYTRLMRDAWLSDLVAHAIDGLGVEGLGCTRKQALQICTGEKMLIGDSRIDSYPGGIEMVDDDGRHEIDWLPGVEEMIKRQTKKLFNSFGRLSANWRDFNIYIPIPTEAGYSLRSPFKFGEAQGAIKIEDAYKKQQADLKQALASLQILYELTGDTFGSLNFDEFEVGISEFEANKVEAEWQEFHRNKETREALKAQEKKTPKRPTKEQEIAKAKKALQSRRIEYTEDLEDSTLKDIRSAWLLPDGTLYKGAPTPYIHNVILDELALVGFFKNKDYGGDEKDVEERGGWIKLSMGRWLYYPHEDESGRKKYITKKQMDVIIDWALANEARKVDINMNPVSLDKVLSATRRNFHQLMYAK